MKFPQIGERQWVTIGTFAFACLLLLMAEHDRSLWNIDMFKTIIQAVVLTGLLNMVLAFHFSSNKGSETARENTGKAFDAIAAAVGSAAPSPDAEAAAQTVADAAQDKADDVRGAS